MTKAQKAEQAEALERLRGWLKPGDTVYTIVRHVARSGMSRQISLIGLEPNADGQKIWDFSFNAAKALGMQMDRDRGAVKIGGCGMDMGFELVYQLSHALFPKGFGCIGENCPASDHSNGDRDYTPHKPEGLKPQAEHWHRSGGYALRQRWL